MGTAVEILEKYWKHTSFRPLQQEIIDSVLNGNDTFALLPTGGGKSICFQVPALMQEGICLVISPLVALMKDQVQNLQKRDIKAMALTGGMSLNETLIALDNCQFGNYKFLYLSPERLQSDWIIERLKKLPINLIAIDEAHCVSQWGHDFRPAYLKIALLKPHFPKTPFMALTASATQRVQDDIILQLALNQPVLFKKSFLRANIAYMVFEIEDKGFRMEQILRKNPEPSIIYVRNRKLCIDTANQLEAQGFKATYYHGGLSAKEKDKNMQLWMQEEKQVMVATNAFGMGIDKANVKTVIHIQLPENIENYYQEAGRAGRNEEKAFAVLLTTPSDKMQAESQFLAVLPDKKFLTAVYIKLNNYFKIAFGEQPEDSFSFNLNHFCVHYQFPVLKTYNAMQFLDQQGILSLSQGFSEKITAQFIIPSKEVIRYLSLNPKDEVLITSILRTYAGIYEIPTALNLSQLAKKTNVSEIEISQLLQKLKEKNIIDYQAKHNDTTLVFNEVRDDERTINRVAKNLEKQNLLKKEQLNTVLYYTTNNNRCKSQLILDYFDEKNTNPCGICSYCIQAKKTESPIEPLSEKIMSLLKTAPMNSREIQMLTKKSSEAIIFALEHLIEKDCIEVQSNNKYTLKL
jgi:ATP-dependent DNA helicase RecQ